MLKYLWLLCLYSFCLYAEVDFDCLVVGTSPTSMFEAIYQTSLGKRVIVVEQASECGGAWKSINICGIEHADMGCHEFGNAETVRQFLEEYAGCKIVSNTPLKKPIRENWGFYPSQGCYELIHNLELLMRKLGTVLLLNSKLETVFIDKIRKVAEVRINGKRLSTSKIIVTNGAEIHFENPEYRNPNPPTKTKYPHLYLLISDPTESRFTYMNFSVDGASRAMNVTRYVGLEGSGMQLIAIQVHNEKYFHSAERFFNEFKKQNLVDPNAKIIQTDHYIYEQVACYQAQLGINNNQIFEYIHTSHIGQINSYFSKWKQAMRPWKEVMNSP